MEKQFLEKVYGYKDIKEELKTIKEWYTNPVFREEKRKLLPRGILFRGEPGAGKTHLMREFSKEFGYPVIVVEGKGEDVRQEVIEAYAKARKLGDAVVVIDELDRLVEDDPKLTRILQTQLDGFGESNTITLAAVNDYRSLPEALVREGRFDRKIRVANRGIHSRDMIEGFARDCGLAFGEDDIELLQREFAFASPSEIKTSLSNAYLRYGENCTYEQVIQTKDYLDTGFVNKSEQFEVPTYMAIHEAGHALYAYLECKRSKFLRVFFNDGGGITKASPIDRLDTVESRIEDIKTSLAGIAAEDVLLGKHDIGCGDDLDHAYEYCFRLINRTSIKGLNYFCSKDTYFDLGKASEYSKTIYDTKTNKFIKRCYKEVHRWMKKRKKQLSTLAKHILDNRGISRKEMQTLVGTE